jgi:hypothetical protein
MKLQVLTKALHGVENPKSQFPVTGLASGYEGVGACIDFASRTNLKVTGIGKTE